MGQGWFKFLEIKKYGITFTEQMNTCRDLWIRTLQCGSFQFLLTIIPALGEKSEFKTLVIKCKT